MGTRVSHRATFAVYQTAVELPRADLRVSARAAKGPRWQSGDGGWVLRLDLPLFGWNVLLACHGASYGVRRGNKARTHLNTVIFGAPLQVPAQLVLDFLQYETEKIH